MPRKELAVDNVAEAYLALLADRGVEYLFANAGTDFAPLVEAFAKTARTGTPVPQPVLATHENLAFSMAHGYAMVTRRVPAVMVHVSVGTANGVCGALNAARDNVPILFTAGRSPLTESGLPGARDVYIHWAQEMFDQAGMLREIVKWDYELRNGEQLETVIDRALSIATTSPGGPVYLSLPREVGRHPEDGEPIKAAIGRFGPYIQHGKTYANLEPGDDIFHIGLNRAVTLLAEAKTGQRRGPQLLREVGPYPGGGTVGLYRGRYGPYVSHDGVYASLPKGADPDTFPLDQALALLAAQKAKGKGRKPARKAAAATSNGAAKPGRPASAKRAALTKKATAAKAKPADRAGRRPLA